MDDMQKPMGIKEIAKLANVSIGTVDRVIHDRPGVSAKTKEKIQKIIKEVGYDPNPLARRLAGFNNIYKVAVIIPLMNEYNPYWKQHLTGIEQAKKLVDQFGIKVEALFFDQRDENSFLDAVKTFFDREFSAAVIVPIFQNSARNFIEQCTVKNLPVICIDTDIEGANNISYIGQNAYQSGYLAGKLASWHINEQDSTIICHVTARKNLHENFSKREQGFKDYLTKEAGVKESQIISLITDAENEELISLELQKTLKKYPQSTGLFIPSTRSFKVIPLLTPEQRQNLFVIGYDLIDENIALLKENGIDVLISQKPEEQCYRAIVFLYKKIVINQEPDKVLDIPIDVILKENIDFYLKQNEQL